MLLSEIAEVSRAVAGTSARLAKIDMLAAALREAGPLEVPIAVAYLSGELPQRQIGVGWAALRDGFAPAQAPTLTLSEVDSGFSAIGAVSGKGSTAARKALVGELFSRATADEQRFLVENDLAMSNMSREMLVKETGDVDRDFVAVMVPHHQGAIDMARAELKYGHDEGLRRPAQNIIAQQQKEISEMRGAIGEPLPAQPGAAPVPQSSAGSKESPAATNTMNMN